MNHDDQVLKFEHKLSNEHPEFMIFKLKDNTNKRLRCRLEYIRNQNVCTIVKESCSKRGKLSKVRPFMIQASKNPIVIECGKSIIQEIFKLANYTIK